MENEVPKDSKEWQLIEKLLSSSMNEQRKARRWGVFFKFLTFAYLIFIIVAFSTSSMYGNASKAASKSEEHTALLDISGMIMADTQANADSIVSSLRDAFEEPLAKAVIMRINSPGGSPVQSGFVYDEIMRLREEYPEKKVYAAITDIGASGAYYIASAAHEIYADKASLVGSIGVISGGFGFSGAMEKIGVDRRVITAGENKAFMDPFMPRNADNEAFFRDVLGSVHQQFIDSVQGGRGERLQDDGKVFSGLIWTGEQAVTFGLIDGLGSPGYVAREIVGQEEIVNYTVSLSPLQSVINKLGVSIGSTLAQQLGMQLQLR